MMCEQDWLSSLEVRVAGHDRVGVTPAERGERALETREPLIDRVALRAQPEAEIEGDLIVAAPTGVELPAERADQLGEPALDRHVDVLVRGEEAEAAGVELAGDGGQAALEARTFPPREQPGAHERVHVRDAAGDIVAPEPACAEQRAR